MNNKKNPLEDEEQFREFLIHLHSIGNNLNSLSLIDRLALDLKYTCISFAEMPDEDTKEFEGLTIKDIIKKPNTPKAPWWNDIYEKKIKPDRELSEAIYRMLLEEQTKNKQEEQRERKRRKRRLKHARRWEAIKRIL